MECGTLEAVMRFLVGSKCMIFSTFCSDPQVIVIVVIVVTLQGGFYIYGSDLGKLELVFEFYSSYWKCRLHLVSSAVWKNFASCL